jgi:hypothetical protein
VRSNQAVALSRAMTRRLDAVLGGADRDGVPVGDALLPDHDDPGVEVDVGPAQPGGLAAAQSAQRDQPPQRVQPVVGDEAKNAASC